VSSTTITGATKTRADAARPAAAVTGRLRSREQAAVALCLYLALALFATWPWITDPGHIVYGVEGGDQTASIASMQQYTDARHPPVLPGRVPDLDAPEGLEASWALHIAGIGSSTALWVLSLMIGSVAAHGLMTVLGMGASAFAMFLLLRRITRHAGVALVVGVTFGFWPYTYVTGWTWPHYIHLWVFVLLFWRMLVVSEEPTVRNGLLAGGAAVVAMTWIQYNLLIATVLFATMVAVALVRAYSSRTLYRQIQAQLGAAAIVGVTAITVVLAAAAQDFVGVPARAADDAVTNSARPLMYLLPGPNHPLFGDSIGDWLQRKYVGPTLDPSSTATYATIYVGIPLLLLALAGIVYFVRELAARRVRPAAFWRPWHWEAFFALTVGFVALLFSAPPSVRVLGISIPMPYTLVNEVTTVFRAAHRFAVVVMMGVSIIEAIGLAALVRNRPRTLQTVALAAVAAMMLVDLWAVPEQRTTKLSSPMIYQLLARQPQGIVAEYPYRDTAWVGAVESLHQDIHEHPLFKGFDEGTESQSHKLELQYLLEPRTIPDLARYGVRYVIIHEAGPAQPDFIPHPRDKPRIGALRYIGGDRKSVLYRISAPPSKYTTYASADFNSPEGKPLNFVRWLRDNGAKLLVLGSCDPCSGTLSFYTGTFARDRVLTVRDPQARLVYQGTIVGEAKRIRIPLRFSNRTALSFSTDPPPDQINKIMGGTDTRSFGVFISQVKFTPNEGAEPRRTPRPSPPA
jgi:hypothetical protein